MLGACGGTDDSGGPPRSTGSSSTSRAAACRRSRRSARTSSRTASTRSTTCTCPPTPTSSASSSSGGCRRGQRHRHHRHGRDLDRRVRRGGLDRPVDRATSRSADAGRLPDVARPRPTRTGSTPPRSTATPRCSGTATTSRRTAHHLGRDDRRGRPELRARTTSSWGRASATRASSSGSPRCSSPPAATSSSRGRHRGRARPTGADRAGARGHARRLPRPPTRRLRHRPEDDGAPGVRERRRRLHDQLLLRLARAPTRTPRTSPSRCGGARTRGVDPDAPSGCRRRLQPRHRRLLRQPRPGLRGRRLPGRRGEPDRQRHRGRAAAGDRGALRRPGARPRPTPASRGPASEQAIEDATPRGPGRRTTTTSRWPSPARSTRPRHRSGEDAESHELATSQTA